MDLGDHGGDIGGFREEEITKPVQLPDDLPKSLDDRKRVSTHYTAETEMYDAWQGATLSDHAIRLIQYWLTCSRAIPISYDSCAG